MKSGTEILEVFSGEDHEIVSKLAYDWTFEELHDLKKRHKDEYDLISNSKYRYQTGTYLPYLENRIKLLEEAIIVKMGDEEQIWDYLT